MAAGSLPAHHRGTRRKYVLVGSYAASMPRKVPRQWAGKDLSRWSVRMVHTMPDVGCWDHGPSSHLLHAGLRPGNGQVLREEPTNSLVRCPRRLRDRWRHGCRHRAPRDGFTACPASGEGTAPSTDPAFASSPDQAQARHGQQPTRLPPSASAT
ncbi:hypothetical protein XACM_2006 [Xanthomonas euvesicatoria pv. citrumelo F1]|nr:hypothetical protein XACM_2006 [Xanthomonas euvesicatoria pv. citrumelo F1]